MKPLEDIIVGLLTGVPGVEHYPELGTSMSVDGIDVHLPLEARIGRDGEVLARVPQYRLATGFDGPTHIALIRFVRRVP